MRKVSRPGCASTRPPGGAVPWFIPSKSKPALLAVAALAAAGLAAAPLSAGAAVLPAQAPASSVCPGATVAAFGPNVCVFSDTMDQASIQTDLATSPSSKSLWPASSTASGTRCSSSPVPMGRRPIRWSSRSVTTPRSRASAHAAGHGGGRRHRRVQQPVHRRDQQLQFGRQLLAVAVQPGRTRTCRVQRRPTRPRWLTPTGRAAPTARSPGRHPRRTRSGAPSSTAASSSRTTGRPTTTPVATSSPQQGQRRPGLLR